MDFADEPRNSANFYIWDGTRKSYYAFRSGIDSVSAKPGVALAVIGRPLGLECGYFLPDTATATARRQPEGDPICRLLPTKRCHLTPHLRLLRDPLRTHSGGGVQSSSKGKSAVTRQ